MDTKRLFNFFPLHCRNQIYLSQHKAVKMRRRRGLEMAITRHNFGLSFRCNEFLILPTFAIQINLR